jgi:hypothetical protein
LIREANDTANYAFGPLRSAVTFAEAGADVYGALERAAAEWDGLNPRP